MRDGYLRGALSRPATPRQWTVLAAYVAAGGSVADAAELVGIRPSTVKRHLADLRARSGLSTEQLIYVGRAAGWLDIPSLEPPCVAPHQAGPPRNPESSDCGPSAVRIGALGLKIAIFPTVDAELHGWSAAFGSEPLREPEARPA
jgi:hypothetical protein